MIVYPEATIYGPVRPDDVHFLVEEHLYKGRVASKLQAPTKDVTGKIAWLANRAGTVPAEQRIVLERAGIINPDSIEDYIIHDGYQALGKVLTEMKPADVIALLKDSGLKRARRCRFPVRSQMGICCSCAGRKEICHLQCR